MRVLQFIILGISLACGQLWAQNPLTRAQVFDFNVGDEFQIQVDGRTGPPTYIYHVILARTPIGTDTIEYQISESSIVYNNNMTITVVPPITVFETYDRLGDTILESYLPNPFGMVVRDTTYADPMLNSRLVTRYSRSDTLPVSSGSANTEWGEGLGLVEYDAFSVSDMIDDFYSLIYYKKGSETFGDVITDLEEADLSVPSVSLYPNPAQDWLRIEPGPASIAGEFHYQILDVQGRILQEADLNGELQIPVESFAKGSYWLRLIGRNGVQGFRWSKL